MAGLLYDDDPISAGMLAAAQGLLTPASQGGGLGSAFGAFGRAASDSRHRGLDAELKRMQIEANRKTQKGQRYITAGGGLIFDTESNSYVNQPEDAADKNDPAQLKLFKFWKGLPEDQQQEMLDVMRGGNYAVKDVAGVPTVISPRQAFKGGSSPVPLSNLPQEIGAEAQKVGAQQAARTAAEISTKDRVQSSISLPKIEEDGAYAIGLLEKLKRHPGMPLAVGDILRGSAPAIYGDQANFVNLHAQIQGQLFLRAFESLKGGGSITEAEGKAATAAIARLQRSGTASEFTEAATELQGILNTLLKRARAKANAGRPSQDAQPAAPLVSQPSTQPTRLRYDPATGDFK